MKDEGKPMTSMEIALFWAFALFMGALALTVVLLIVKSDDPAGFDDLDAAFMPPQLDAPQPEHAFCALECADYEFSDEPRGVAEEWLASQMPEAWSAGVRALTTTPMVAAAPGQPDVAGVLVQYVDGVRYEGTDSTPLGLRGQDPAAFSVDTVSANMARFADVPDISGNIGQGGYAAELHSGGGQFRVAVEVIRPTWTEEPRVVSSVSAASPDAALQYLASNAWAGDRVLLPGEVGSITWFEDNGDGTATVRVWDPQAERWLEAGSVHIDSTETEGQN